jgi:uncharacterized protein YbjT (DUF2867 family)
MKILLTGANGYIGRRLLPVLIAQGHEVYCCVRDRARFDITPYPAGKVTVLEADFLYPDTLHGIPPHIDVAYYLIHSMSASTGDFTEMEKTAALHFADSMALTAVQQVIYLSGIVNNDTLSRHLFSRKAVEAVLGKGGYQLTTLRAGIVVGSGSASFEIIRDLVEKLPVMVAPKWLLTRSQPIAVHNVLEFLSGVLLNEETFGKAYDIGGPEILTYKEMLLQFASVRGLRRSIFIVPIMTPRLSSYWLYFITSTSYKLAVNLVHSMKIEVVCRPNDLAAMLGIRLIRYSEAVAMAFRQTLDDEVVSSWIDARSGKTLHQGIEHLISVPSHGCLTDTRTRELTHVAATWQNIYQIGGKNGWYFANMLWATRGFIDKLLGGVGLRRGRRSYQTLQPGETLDFWRVIDVNPNTMRLLLFAEMKLPGEAWLEFKITGNTLTQTATFRPLGLAGRIYWYSIYPLHSLVFRGMINRIAADSQK